MDEEVLGGIGDFCHGTYPVTTKASHLLYVYIHLTNTLTGIDKVFD